MALKEELSAAGGNEAAAIARASVLRSFARQETRARGIDLLRRFEGGKIYPYRNPAVVRAIAKTVRGLAFYFGLFKALRPERVSVTYAPFPIPPQLQAHAAFRGTQEEDVFSYWGYRSPARGQVQPDWRMFWRLRYFERVEFDVLITK